MVCAVRGYRCIIVLPDGTSNEKRAVLTAFGAEIVVARSDVDACHPEGYIGRAEKLAKELGAFNPDQFENAANPGAHFTSTGPEIVAACDGRLDAFVACVGSGGTLGGTSRYLKEHVPGVVIYGAAPDHDGCAGPYGGTLVEGIVEDVAACEGQGVTPDAVIRVHDKDAVAMTLRLAREEAILGGGSDRRRGVRGDRDRGAARPGEARGPHRARYRPQLSVDVLRRRVATRARPLIAIRSRSK